MLPGAPRGHPGSRRRPAPRGADTYTRAHAQTIARVRARLAEAMAALDLLEGERLRLQGEYLLREANPFTHQRLAGLLRDARRIAGTTPATTRHSA